MIAEKRQQPAVEMLQAKLGNEQVFHFGEVIQHVPIDLAEKATKAYLAENCELLVAIGGGSAIGLAKALALETGHRIIAVPTTYAGSEMTNIWGITTTEGGKTTGRDARVLRITRDLRSGFHNHFA